MEEGGADEDVADPLGGWEGMGTLASPAYEVIYIIIIVTTTIIILGILLYTYMGL